MLKNWLFVLGLCCWKTSVPLMAQMQACCLHGVDAVPCKQSCGGEEDDMGLFSESCASIAMLAEVHVSFPWSGGICLKSGNH